MPLLLLRPEYLAGSRFVLSTALLKLEAFATSRLRPKPPPGMPVQENVYRDHDRKELETTEEHLMSAQKLLQALCRLRQTKAGPQVDGKCRHKHRSRELLERW